MDYESIELEQRSQTESLLTLPVFTRAVYAGWLAKGLGTDAQRKRYRELVAYYDALGVTTPEDAERKRLDV